MNTAILSTEDSSNELRGTIHNSNSLQGEMNVSAFNPERIQHYETFEELPAIGNSKLLYIVDGENATYRFDGSTLTYECIGRDWKEIQGVDGGTP